MFLRLLGPAGLYFPLIPGCANTKQREQTDSKSILRKADGGQEIHGEVGAMYGVGAR